jgi:acyl-coenzyme A thioesterase PaaI-like protein
VTEPIGGHRYGELVERMRDMQDAFILSNPPATAIDKATALVEQLAELFRASAVNETESPAGKRPDLPGRGSLLLLPVVATEVTNSHFLGHVRFRDFHRGGRSNAAHGGTHALLFDEVIGKLVARSGVHRTAYLHVDYREVLPVGVELDVDATVDRVEGRKVFASGRIKLDGRTVAESEGLWIRLRPGQP